MPQYLRAIVAQVSNEAHGLLVSLLTSVDFFHSRINDILKRTFKKSSNQSAYFFKSALPNGIY